MGFIYKATNTKNGKVYIGKTHCSIEKRWKEHVFCSYCEESSAYDLYFHRAIRKYGEQAFLVEKIEECDDDLLNEREMFWINKFGSFGNGYNLTNGGEGRLIYKDEEILKEWNSGKTLKEISNTLGINQNRIGTRIKSLGITREEIQNRKTKHIVSANIKPVYQYDLDGNFVAEYKSISEIKNQKGFAGIHDAIIGKSKTAGGYQWRRFKADKIDPIWQIKRTAKQIYQYSLSGDYIRSYGSVYEVVMAYGVAESSVYASCNEHEETLVGFQWRYFKADKIQPTREQWSWCNNKAVAQYDLNGKLIKVHRSITEAAKTVNAAHATISEACRGKRKVSKGFIWKYITEPLKGGDSNDRLET